MKYIPCLQTMQSPAKIRDAILIKQNEILRLQKSFTEAKHKQEHVPQIETHEEYLAKLKKKEMLKIRRESAFELLVSVFVIIFSIPDEELTAEGVLPV